MEVSYGSHPTNIAMEMCLRLSTWLLAIHGTSCYRSECPTATKELRELHFSFLNQAYNKNVYKLWKDAGCYQDVALHLGYRLVLKKVAMFFCFCLLVFSVSALMCIQQQHILHLMWSAYWILYMQHKYDICIWFVRQSCPRDLSRETSSASILSWRTQVSLHLSNRRHFIWCYATRTGQSLKYDQVCEWNISTRLLKKYWPNYERIIKTFVNKTLKSQR